MMFNGFLPSMTLAPEDGSGTGDPVEPQLDLEDDETSDDPTQEDDTEGVESEDEQGADESSETAPPPPQSRGDRSIGELRKRARETAETNARLTRELDDLRRQVSRPAYQPQETPQQRADRLSLLSPEDRVLTIAREEHQAFAQQQAFVNAQLLDNSDRAAFEARAARNPLAQRLAGEVERRLADMRARGERLPSREVIFTYLVGERTLANQGKANTKAAANRQRQTARPANSQGDIRPARTRQPTTAEDFESRFGDVPI
jgi:hypothetical protein